MNTSWTRLSAVALAAFLLQGCSAFRINVKEQDPQGVGPLTDKYDQQDLLTWGQLAAEEVLNTPFPPADEHKPILAPMGIENRTRTHLDTKMLMDTITTNLLRSGQIQLVNTDRRDDLLREQGYQLANCSPQAQVQIGRQLGAKYMITGSLSEISQESGREVRVSRTRDVYYQLTLEVTDLETGLIALRIQRDRLRRSTRPIIGW